MLARKRLRALARMSSPCGDALTLSLLYCTKTILGRLSVSTRSYQDGSTLPIATTDELPPPNGPSAPSRKPRSPTGRHAKRSALSLGTEAIYHPAASQEPLHSPGPNALPRRQLRSHLGRPERESEVPFEGLPTQQDHDPDVQGSTITPSERKAFEKLLATHPSGGEQTGLSISPSGRETLKVADNQQDYERHALVLDGILGSALSRSFLPEALRETGPAGRDRFRGKLRRRDMYRLQDTKAEEELDSSFMAEMREVEEKMMSANTDTEVWRIFQEQVVDVLVRMLSSGPKFDSVLQEPKPAGRTKKTRHSRVTDESHDHPLCAPKPSHHNPHATNSTIMVSDTPTAAPVDRDACATASHAHQTIQSLPGRPGHDPATLARLLSIHTMHAQISLSERFRGSSFALSVLPAIRNLGPVACAFVLNQGHYSLQLRQLWKQYQDLPAMLELLQVMDVEVINFDESTVATINHVLNFAVGAKSGLYGGSVQALWSMDMKTTCVREMRGWLSKIMKYRQEEELRRTRVEDAIEEGAIDGERIRFETSGSKADASAAVSGDSTKYRNGEQREISCPSHRHYRPGPPNANISHRPIRAAYMTRHPRIARTKTTANFDASGE